MAESCRCAFEFDSTGGKGESPAAAAAAECVGVKSETNIRSSRGNEALTPLESKRFQEDLSLPMNGARLAQPQQRSNGTEVFGFASACDTSWLAAAGPAALRSLERAAPCTG